MKPRQFPFVVLIFTIWLSQLLSSAESRPLNVIFFLVDDWGWTDGGVFGSDFYETPHVDQLASSGVRFTNAYAACTVCSPTRSAVMTGLYPARTHVTDWIAGHSTRFQNTPMLEPDWTQELEHLHITIAELLKKQGYKTASIGKWHLTPKGPPGSDRVRAFWPEHHGFDINIGGNQFGSPGSYFFPYGTGENQRLNMPDSKEGDYITDRLADEAVELIRNWQKEPFFIYFPFYQVHTPIQAKDVDLKYFEEKLEGGEPASLRHNSPAYAAMLKAMDDAIGRILSELERLGIRDNTMIILTGDNGGLMPDWANITNNAPLRDGKGSVYEGGVRVPCVVDLPFGVSGITSDIPIISNDFFPTIASALEIGIKRLPTDGEDLMPILIGLPERMNERDLFWHYPHYHTEGATPYSAIRSGNYRLIEYHLDGNVELYDLNADIGERNELSRQHPDVVHDLKLRLNEWRTQVGAQMAIPNPDYKSTEPTLSPQQVRQLARENGEK